MASHTALTAQRVGQVGRVAPRQVHQPGPGELVGQGGVFGIGPVAHGDDDGLDSEPLRLLGPQAMPSSHDRRSVRDGCRGQLHVTGRPALQQSSLDFGHLGQVLARPDQRQRPGSGVGRPGHEPSAHGRQSLLEWAVTAGDGL